MQGASPSAVSQVYEHSHHHSPIGPRRLIREVRPADLARMQLAMEDIPTFLGGAALVTWFWHYGNFSGGAKVFVSAADAERVVAVLRPSRGRPARPAVGMRKMRRAHRGILGDLLALRNSHGWRGRPRLF